MKKSVLFLAATFGVTGAFAQDLTSKKGEPFLPEAGDYAIGIDASPILNYLGNFFGKNTPNAAPTFNFANSNFSITGKKFKDANNAYRASVRVGLSSSALKKEVLDANITALPVYPALPSYKEDKGAVSSTVVALSAGVEKRRGKTRLQGVYGAEAVLALNTASEKYTYGNALSSNNSVNLSTTADFGNNIISAPWPHQAITARVTSRKSGLGLNIGARAFVGAEYFVAPKISIGGEFGWGLGLAIQGKSTTTVESTDKVTVATHEIKGDSETSFSIDTDNKNSVFGPSASLRLNLHF